MYKRLLLILVILLGTGIILFNCSKDKNNPLEPPLPTTIGTLKVIVDYTLGGVGSSNTVYTFITSTSNNLEFGDQVATVLATNNPSTNVFSLSVGIFWVGVTFDNTGDGFHGSGEPYEFYLDSQVASNARSIEVKENSTTNIFVSFDNSFLIP